MIVCICNNVSDREIRQAVDVGLGTMSQLRQDLGIGTCCGKCHSCAKKILQDCLGQQAAARQDTQALTFHAAAVAA